MKQRLKNIDVLRGVLIIFVVMAHFSRGLIHDIIFLFHMPLFFILSGYLLDRTRVKDNHYIKSRAATLLVPYICYLLLDWIFVQRIYSLNRVAHLIWGGRSIAGIYWYITCFLFALTIFGLLIRHFSDKIVKILILAGGGIAVIESHLSERISFLRSPGIPENIDVSLLALMYLAIGFYYKDKIREIIESSKKRYDIIAVAVTLLLFLFGYFNYQGEEPLYYFDMKPLYYKELFLAIVVPCAFGFVISRVVRFINRFKIADHLMTGIAYLGQMTIPIMFLHVPINNWKGVLGYGRLAYILIGIGIPVIFTVIFNRYSVMRKLFGLPKIKKYR